MTTVYLSLGSNLGDRLNYLTSAIKCLSEEKNVTIKEISPVYETKPWGLKEQDDFYNLVLEITTTLSPHDLLTTCQQIEHQLGRVREVPFGPRTIDIDLLLYGDETLSSERLTIPHPLMCERDFVLVPLYDLAPQIKISGVEIAIHLNQLVETDSSPKPVTELLCE